jgi:hypothetical protein
MYGAKPVLSLRTCLAKPGDSRGLYLASETGPVPAVDRVPVGPASNAAGSPVQIARTLRATKRALTSVENRGACDDYRSCRSLGG